MPHYVGDPLKRDPNFRELPIDLPVREGLSPKPYRVSKERVFGFRVLGFRVLRFRV